MKSAARTLLLIVSMFFVLGCAVPQPVSNCEPYSSINSCCKSGCCSMMQHCGCSLRQGSPADGLALAAGVPLLAAKAKFQALERLIQFQPLSLYEAARAPYQSVNFKLKPQKLFLLTRCLLI